MARIWNNLNYYIQIFFLRAITRFFYALLFRFSPGFPELSRCKSIFSNARDFIFIQQQILNYVCRTMIKSLYSIFSFYLLLSTPKYAPTLFRPIFRHFISSKRLRRQNTPESDIYGVVLFALFHQRIIRGN